MKDQFQYTEFGLIPNDWILCKFKDALDTFSSGATPYRAIREYYEGHIRWVSSGELNYNIIYDTIEHISEKAVKNTNLRRHKAGTFLMAITGLEAEGTRGRCAILGDVSTTNQSCLALNGTDRLCVDFLFVFYKMWGDYLAFKYCQGSKQQSYTAQIARSLPIYFPPSIEEQQKIADALRDIDLLIEGLKQKIAKKRAIKEGAMQQLLTGKKRLAGFSETWTERHLGDILATITNGLTYNPESTKGIPVTRIETISMGIVDYNRVGFANNTSNAERYRMLSGDILFSHINSMSHIGKVAIYDGEKELYHGMNLLLLRTNKLADPRYLYFFLTSYKANAEIKLMAKQAINQASINIQELSGWQFLLPTKTEQQAIAQILTDIDNEIAELEQKQKKYTTLKQGAMQKLLTGQIRLVDTPVIAKQHKANDHFRRSVWAGEIIDRVHEEPTFGHVKMEKLLFLTEKLSGVNIGSNYHRGAAGPYDNRAIRSIDSQIKKQKWFEAKRTDKGYRYTALSKRGGHKKYFDQYFLEYKDVFDRVIKTMQKWDTEHCEIVATLYSAWEDLIISKKEFDDDNIVDEVLNNWHESKKRIERNRWLSALNWMRDNSFTPKILE